MDASATLVVEPVERRLSDRQFGVVVGGVALAAAAVVGALILLPRGFGIALVLLLTYPIVQVLRGAWRAYQAKGPRLVISAASLEAGGLRFAWRDVTDVGVGPSARSRDRRDRVKVRLNRLVPVRPTDSALRATGLELGDQYFDFAIPPGYDLAPTQIAAAIEERRGAVRRAAASFLEEVRGEPAPAEVTAASRSHPRPRRPAPSRRAARATATSPAPKPPRRTRPR